MNTHTVGGNSEKTKFIGMDQYGNKYYQDFNPLCKKYNKQIRTREDGSNIMIIYLFVVLMEI